MLTTKQAAKALNLSESRIKLLIKQGRIRAKKHGRDWQILGVMVLPVTKKTRPAP